MKKMIVLFCMLFSLNSWSFWCSTFDKALDVGSVATASILECERVDLIKLDYVRVFQYDRFCGEEIDKGVFCNILSQAVSNALPYVVPKEWECKLNLASQLTRVSFEYVCNTLAPQF